LGEDPHFEAPDFSVNALENPVILVRMKVSDPGHCQVYWGTSDEPDMDESKSFPFYSGAANEWQLHILNLNDHPGWKGTITQLRIDPSGSSGEVLIDFVRVCPAARISATILDESFNHITGNGVEYYETSRAAYIDNGVIRVGIDKEWGGAIREIWYNGTNIINNYDSGRLAGISVYDGLARDTYNESDNYEGWGWNPVPSDKYGHVNHPQTISFQNNTLYVKSLNLQWNPDDKGGGPQDAVVSDLLVETWLTLFPDSPRLIQLLYRVTHVGADHHLGNQQEFPYTYVNRGFDRVVYYNGSKPWAGENVSVCETPLWPGQKTVSSENWVALVDDKGVGLAFYAPYDYPYFNIHHFSMPYEADTNYVNQLSVQEYSPGKVYENSFYYLVGDWQDSRATINELSKQIEDRDTCSPFGFLESPGQGATLSGITLIQGWAADNVGVEKVEVRLNNSTLGQAAYGEMRQDVADDTCALLPNSPDFGYSFELDTRKFPNGEHTLQVRCEDSSGNVVTPWYGEVVVRFDNQVVSTVDIDDAIVSDDHCDVGTMQTVSLHASWSVDGSDAANGLIKIGEYYKTNSTGWITIEVTEEVPGSKTFTASEVNCNGITSFRQTIPSPTIIYDRVRIVDGGVSADSVSVQQPVTVWVKAIYEYDREEYSGEKGSIKINDVTMSWSSANQRWEKEFTSSDPKTVIFEVTSFQDSKYGLTIFHDAVNISSVEWSQAGISGYPPTAVFIGLIAAIFLIMKPLRRNPLDPNNSTTASS